jgi:Ala-tRNA(Pro) deacylase
MDRRLKQFLEEHGVKYEVLQHAATFTAMETADATHIAGIELAKTVIVRIDWEMQMAVVPATHYVDLEKLRVLLGADAVELADEMDFIDRFPDCESGAMPPFGNLYGMKVYAAEALLDDEDIVFNAGTHTEAVRISLADYLRVVAPLVHNISRRRELV